MKAYEDIQQRDGVVISEVLQNAFDKASKHDNMLESIIGLRNSAWAAIQSDNMVSSNALYYAMNALLNDDTEVLLLMRYPIV